MSQIEKTIVENQNEINKFLVKLFEEKNKVKLFEEKNKVKKRKASKMIYHFNVLGETYNSDIFVDNYRDFLLNVSKILDCNKFEILPNGYFKKNKYEFTKSYRKSSIDAAISGHIHVIQWAFSNGVPPSDATRACTYAAANGQLRCLQYLKKCGVDWDASVCSFAAMKGHLDILRYAKSKNCPCSSQASAWAGANGHFEVLKWLYDNWWATGPVWDEETFAIIASSKLPRSFNRPPIGIDKKESDQSPKDQSPKNQSPKNQSHNNQSSSITLDILKWMHEKKCPIDARAAQWALESLNTLVLQWLVTINVACHRVVRTCKVPPTFQSHPNLLALIKSLQ